MRIVLDTNCFLAILPKISPYRTVFDAYRQGRFELAVSTEILAEYEEIFGSRMTPTIAQNVLSLVDKQPNTVRVNVFYSWNLITSDPDDNKFVDAAIASNADYLVTHDGHFRVLSEVAFPNVVCLTLAEFIRVLDEREA
jgi:putative PIN family toxin of toxin-antitoxin system